jgi:chromosome segregation ATPase
MEKDHEILGNNYALLMQERNQLSEESQSLQDQLNGKESEMLIMEESIRDRDNAIAMRDREISQLQTQLNQSDKEKILNVAKLETVQEEYALLQNSLHKLTSTLDQLRGELIAEKKERNSLTNKVKQFQEESRLNQSDMSGLARRLLETEETATEIERNDDQAVETTSNIPAEHDE